VVVVHQVTVSSTLASDRGIYSQFEEGEVGIAVVCLVGALLGDVFLEYRRRLRVVAVESVQDGVDVLRPVGRVVECNAHVCGGVKGAWKLQTCMSSW